MLRWLCTKPGTPRALGQLAQFGDAGRTGSGNSVAEVPFHARCETLRAGVAFRDCTKAGTPIKGILHFAAHKAVERACPPAMYVQQRGRPGTLLQVASAFDVRNVVFSSSCTVYGEPEVVPVDESTPFQEAESPYGWTKQACERVLKDHATHVAHRVALLRYQPHRGAPKRPPGRIALGRAEQPDSLPHPGRGGNPWRPNRVWWGLPDPGWHVHSRLPACDGFGRGACRSPAMVFRPNRPRPCRAVVQPWHGTRRVRPGGHSGL